jgi:predicted unusual protein kinase regulating ubiquinone biosynthesis (AarF/ABC1/UbiB family)
MGLSLKPGHLKRYRDIAALFLKYGRSDLLLETQPVSNGSSSSAEDLAGDLEKLGPTFVKVGQLLSTRGDLLSADALRSLSRLQDDVEPFPFKDVERIVGEELGVRPSKAFSRFDTKPIAAASLGQVHRAALRDGREVAVKVQRPNVREQVLRDMETLEELAGFADEHTRAGKRLGLSHIADEMRRSILNELDYRREAHNMVTLGGNLSAYSHIVIPRPVVDYSSERVLTMDFVAGQKITAVSRLVLADVHARDLAEELFRAYLHQVIIDGFFHADPHPGNVLLADDGRIALLDLGMVSRLSPDVQDRLLQLLVAAADGRNEQAADLALEMGDRLESYDEAVFRRHIAEAIARTRDARIDELPAGLMMLQLARVAMQAGVRLPHPLTLLGKTLLNLEEVGRTLSPKFDVQESIRRNANSLMVQRMRRSLSVSSAFTSILEAKTFAERLPGRVNRVLDALVNQELKLRVEMIDEGSVLEGLQKIANRITLGLLLAAMIIGAAMLMRVDTAFRVLGYPAIAMFFFLTAAIGACWLAMAILRGDRRRVSASRRGAGRTGGG